MVLSQYLISGVSRLFHCLHGRKWQRAVMLRKPLASGSSKPRAAAGSQADHPELLCVALHLSRALTALHLPGYMWLLLGEVLCIKVSGIYSSLTAGRSRHRKILKFSAFLYRNLPKLFVNRTEPELCMCVHVCPRVFLLQHGEPPGASGHGACSWGWDVLVSVRVRRGVLFCVKEGWVLRSSSMARMSRKWKLSSTGLLMLG